MTNSSQVGALKKTAELSDREREVLKLSAQGKSMDEIAALLNVSLGRVREHSRAAIVKLGARTYIQAVVIAMRNRLIEGCEEPR